MPGRRAIAVVSITVGLVVGAFTLAVFIAFASMPGPNGGGDVDLSLDWWVLFGTIALMVGAAAAALVYAVTRPSR